MKIEELKSKTEADISDFIAKKIAELKKRQVKKFLISSLRPERK